MSQEIGAYVGPGLSVEGALRGEGDARIEGRFEGVLEIDGVLTVGRSARVKARVRAGAVSVAGEVEGRVEATAMVEVHPGGRIRGDVTAPEVTVEEAAEITGRIERTGRCSPKPAADGLPPAPRFWRARARRRTGAG